MKTTWILYVICRVFVHTVTELSVANFSYVIQDLDVCFFIIHFVCLCPMFEFFFFFFMNSETKWALFVCIFFSSSLVTCIWGIFLILVRLQPHTLYMSLFCREKTVLFTEVKVILANKNQMEEYGAVLYEGRSKK